MKTQSRWLTVALSVTLSVVLIGAFHVVADEDASTDGVPRLFPYKGHLERDGAPVTAIGADAIPMEFTLYDGAAPDSPAVYRQQVTVEVFAGEFTAVIGPEDETQTSLEEVIAAADDLHLGIVLPGDEDDVVLMGRQRLHLTPYSIWSTRATNFDIAGTLTTHGDAQLGGTVDIAGDVTVGSPAAEATFNVSGDAVIDGDLSVDALTVGTINGGVPGNYYDCKWTACVDTPRYLYCPTGHVMVGIDVPEFGGNEGSCNPSSVTGPDDYRLRCCRVY